MCLAGIPRRRNVLFPPLWGARPSGKKQRSKRLEQLVDAQVIFRVATVLAVARAGEIRKTFGGHCLSPKSTIRSAIPNFAEALFLETTHNEIAWAAWTNSPIHSDAAVEPPGVTGHLRARLAVRVIANQRARNVVLERKRPKAFRQGLQRAQQFRLFAGRENIFLQLSLREQKWGEGNPITARR